MPYTLGDPGELNYRNLYDDRETEIQHSISNTQNLVETNQCDNLAHLVLGQASK